MVETGTASFGDRLRRLREAAGLTQEELAERSGLSRDAVSALERGHRKHPHPQTIHALSVGLGLSEGDVRELRAAAPRRGGGQATTVAAPVVEAPAWPLPVPATGLVGRTRELGDVERLLTGEGVRLVTLTGPGGVGKTRLALELASGLRPRFPGGVAFVSLASIQDADLILPSIADALGLRDAGSGPLVERIGHALMDRRVLLVLDNLEHLTEAAPAIAELLAACREMSVVATSRAALRLSGEHEYPIAPLGSPALGRGTSLDDLAGNDAVALFVQRARAARPSFALTRANAGAVAEICARLDGLPLAIELAAARVKVLPPEALLARLGSGLGLLAGGPRDQAARLQSLRAAIAWSYGLLAPGERALFRRLAVFRGGFALEDAEAILGPEVDGGGDEIDVLDGVATLVDQSLLTSTEREGGDVRFRMLETIREFGLEQLVVAGDVEPVQTRFAEHWRALAEETWVHAAELEGLDRAIEPLERNHDNVRAALDWLEGNDPDRAAELAGALWWFWYQRSHYAEAMGRLRRLLALPAAVVPAARRPRMLLAAGAFSHFLGDTAGAVVHLEEALGRWREAGDAWGTGFTLLALGLIDEDTGAYDRARERLEEAAELLAAAGDEGSIATAHYHLAVVAFGVGDLDAAEGFVARVLDEHHGGAVRVTGWALLLRGLLCHARGDLCGSIASQREALRRFWESRNPSGVADALAGIAVVGAEVGMPSVVRVWAAAERMVEEEPFQAPERLVYEGAMARLRERIGEAAYVVEHAAGAGWSVEEAVAEATAIGEEVARECEGRRGAGGVSREM